MSGFSILMFIFSICVFLFGLYIYRGHDVRSLLWRARYKNLTKTEWKNVGKWTMITSIGPLILALVGIFM